MKRSLIQKVEHQVVFDIAEAQARLQRIGRYVFATGLPDPLVPVVLALMEN